MLPFLDLTNHRYRTRIAWLTHHTDHPEVSTFPLCSSLPSSFGNRLIAFSRVQKMRVAYKTDEGVRKGDEVFNNYGPKVSTQRLACPAWWPLPR
jgi:hypothetical protein